MLPYPSYLRVYEPAAANPPGVSTSIDVEQQRVLEAAVVSSVRITDTDSADHCYVMQRGGRTYVCPLDLPLRSWLSLTSLIDSIGDTAARAIIPAQVLAAADDRFLRWRQNNPDAVPHIRQSLWGVPRTWFVLVVDSERELYEQPRGRSIRYRARVAQTRRRLARAYELLRSVLDDGELVEELADLSTWLGRFSSDGWVELDYAGVARWLPGPLEADHSAGDIHRALDAVAREDFGSAGVAYRAFEERWRVVNQYERAN